MLIVFIYSSFYYSSFYLQFYAELTLANGIEWVNPSIFFYVLFSGPNGIECPAGTETAISFNASLSCDRPPSVTQRLEIFSIVRLGLG